MSSLTQLRVRAHELPDAALCDSHESPDAAPSVPPSESVGSKNMQSDMDFQHVCFTAVINLL
jgi:hypothetical protein